MRKVRYILSFVLLAVALAPSLRATTLSEQAEITLITASPGDELYSVFGHSALRVNDPEQGLDIVFNYGTFDFNTPNFYMKFSQGKLLYKLSVGYMENFVPEYNYEGRAILEQVLNLTQPQKQALLNFLLINRQPENAYYHYDFFHDNCATRIRDVVEAMFAPQWAYDSILDATVMEPIRADFNGHFSYFQPEARDRRTFRDMLQPLLKSMPWSTFGIDIALGLPADKVAHPFDYMYLPDEMLVAFARATLPDGQPLIIENRVILPLREPLSPAGFFTPLKVFWLLFVLALLSFLSKRFSRLFDLIFFNTLALIGLLIVFLWFFSDHITTKGNMNLLWALPTHLYFIWKAGYDQKHRLVNIYFQVTNVLALLLLITWPWIPQAFNPAFFPIVLTLFVKSMAYAYRLPGWLPIFSPGDGNRR